jgi:hypothetical protein
MLTKNNGQALDGFTSFALMVVAVVTAYGIYRWQIEAGGLENASFITKGGAVLFSTGIAVAVAWLWHALYAAVPYLRSMRSRLAVLGVALVGTVFVCFASANSTAAAISGVDAVNHSIDVQIAAFERATSKRDEAANQIGGVITDLSAIISKLEADAKGEAERGTITGVASGGAVVRMLSQMALQLKELRTAILKHQEDGKATLATARDDLAAMRATSGAGLSPPERMKRVGAAADALREKLNRLDTRPLSAAMTRVIESMGGEAGSVALNLSLDPKIAQRQRVALDRLQKDIAATTQRLVALGHSLAAQELENVPGFRVMNGAEAVRVYWRSFITTWCASLLLDCMPFIGLGLLLLTAGTRSQADITRERLLGLTIEQLILLSAARSSLDAVDRKVARDILASMFGDTQR